jgi:hypothetical protein
VFEEIFEQVYTIRSDANVTITNGDGAVLLYGSNVDQMQVHAVKRAYSQRRLAQIGIDVLIEADSVSITTRFPPKPAWGLSDRSGTVEYTIVVPAVANISTLHLDAGEILLDGMRGHTTRAELGEGRMFARNCFSTVDLAIRRGNISLGYDWWEQGELLARANIAQGNIWVYLPADAACHLSANAPHGKILNDFTDATAGAVFKKTTKIDQLINTGGQAVINVRVEKGDINILRTNP